MRIIFRTILEDNYISQIRKSKINYTFSKNDLLENALSEFIKKNDKVTYVVKFNNFERIKTRNYIFTIDVKVAKKIYDLMEKLNLTQTQLLREILIPYLNANHN
ncbi:MAG: hypothetical protein IPM32_12405 [Ignavibacteriae bacterium]|nr:hypothetical protein [Ignavibacteriota bacterium]